MDESTSQLGLQYPCSFPIKVIGSNEPDFDSVVIEILLKHVPDLDTAAITYRDSSGGKYRSLNSTFIAQSREQLDALYIELGKHPYVKWIV
jgi:uncharacterized protein